MINITHNNISFTKGDTLSLKVDIVDADDQQFIPDPTMTDLKLALKLYQVTYVPKEGVQDIHNVTCTLPHEKLVINYKKILTPYKSYTGDTPLVVGDESTTASIIVSSADTDTWDMDDYEYRLQLCNDNEVYTIVDGSFSVI